MKMAHRPTAMYPGDFTPSPGASRASQWHNDNWPKGNHAYSQPSREATLLAIMCFPPLWPFVAMVVAGEFVKGMRR